MIIVLLLFFQSLCLYCQRLVLHIYDRWINPKNVRLLTETAETSCSLIGNRKTGSSQPPPADCAAGKRVRKRNTSNASSAGAVGGATSVLPETEACRFCANTPQGYCRHHFHLQELQLQQQQQKYRWMPLALNADKSQEYRQLRKINRELKRNLKNRLHVDQHKHPQQQQRLTKPVHQPSAYYKHFPIDSSSYHYPNDTLETSTEDSGYHTTSSSSCNLSLHSVVSANLSVDANKTASENNVAQPTDVSACEAAAADAAATADIYYFEPPSVGSSRDTEFTSQPTISTTYL